MRFLILALSILAIVGSTHVANAGLSTSPRGTTAPAETASASEDANQQTENQIGLTNAKRRAVQRGLTRLGFDTKANGAFDERTRAAIARWQEERGYPATGYLDATQHKALMDAATEAAKSDRQARRSSGGRTRHSRNAGGPIGAIGGAMHRVVGGIFGR
ncbi:peptidoglycan-binding domain-containing protein [Bradyrhizobium sp. HKCCYLS2038]|uniref:peptidoglycan-binding domain-containing protein n=1 Tax=unclassified Bradyrhizobium TaxID=2631580 RepID=UPI003EBA5DD0